MMESVQNNNEGSYSREAFGLRDRLQRRVIELMMADGQDKNTAVEEWIKTFSDDFSKYFDDNMKEDSNFVEKLQSESFEDIAKAYALRLQLTEKLDDSPDLKMAA